MSDSPHAVALVTGASRGIGRAIALHLARQGVAVALTARGEPGLQETEALIQSDGGTARYYPADIGDPVEVEAMVDSVEETLGPIDLLVNNAGAFSVIGPLWEIDADGWWRDMTVNVRGVFLTCRAVVPRMIVRNHGRVVNVVSGAVTKPFPFGAGYAASKAAVQKLSENLARELELVGSPVKVFTMSPGFIRTAMTEQFQTTEAGRTWMDYMAKRLEEGADIAPESAGEFVVAIHNGRLDSLAGRHFSAPSDLEHIEELIEESKDILQNDRRTLGLR